MHLNENLSTVAEIGGLAEKIIVTRKHIIFSLIYLLVKLSLILPVPTTIVEFFFSVMKLFKSSLCNQMGKHILTDCLITRAS